ncbi:putative F-box/FBD/LRR-repeat protein At5g44950 [Brachypodium distachyon]|uniref:putative F-box/FBD/LRR-repeat protein At5g44950 n=1 Tax=Brachypodium distachyon TaxID=15368 RepID=UPI000D0D95D9|nr:putative F-box/FBD/LRR-repeat protein At5g44950 [Brachypodium distachyon]|eukprot:XP_010233446.2 putative F-box/FBD/LRR-repeat protein At5g44950 [Brachypodium distachyon]
MASSGVDAQTVDLGGSLSHYDLHDHVPKPLVSPAAPLALSGASWVPDGVDRISRLPDVVLHNIVSRLPAKDAARTAALASRWRPLWLSAPLTLVDDHLLPDSGEWNITSTVSRVLAAHLGPFRCVHLSCSKMDEHRNELERWLVLLAAKGVQELIFVNSPWPVDLCLPATLFSSASLTRLCLGIWRLPDTAAVPRAATFLNLRELLLSFSVMSDRDLAFMLERSPVLEILTVVGGQSGEPARLRLVSHSLRCVQLGLTRLEEIHVMDTPNLERLLQWNAVGKHHVSSILCKKGRSRIKIGHAPKLRLLGYLEPGDDEIEISNTVIVAGTRENIVPSIKILAIRVKFGVRNALKKVPGYLRCFPNLETLHVQSHKHVETTGKVNFKFWQEGGPIKCVLQTMKKVFFYEFRGSRSEVAFLKFIAERAQVLEKMVIMVASECFSSGDDVSPKLRPLDFGELIVESNGLQ